MATTRTMRAGWGSLGVAVVALGLKLGAWRITGSVALYSDALETIINVFAAVAALAALRVSAQPPDSNHPYGHQKAEYFSAVVEGMMVLGAAVAIGHEAWDAWAQPAAPAQPVLGMTVNGLAGVLNFGWAAYLIRAGRAWRSPAILASGRHVLTDVWTSAGVLVAFALVPLTGWLWLDPAIAALVALNIVRTGIGMVRESVDALMDVSVAPETLQAIRAAIGASASGAIEAHDLRTRASGPITFVEFHLVVPARMTVEDAHVICDRIEAALRAAIGDATITIHVEPETKAKRHGTLVVWTGRVRDA